MNDANAEPTKKHSCLAEVSAAPAHSNDVGKKAVFFMMA